MSIFPLVAGYHSPMGLSSLHPTDGTTDRETPLSYVPESWPDLRMSSCTPNIFLHHDLLMEEGLAALPLPHPGYVGHCT